jgi:lipopolysaccharide transport protein LptA
MLSLARILLWSSTVLLATPAWTQPLNITAERLDVEHATGTATFRGKVKAIQSGDGFTLEADTLTISYATGKGAQGVNTITAKGQVVIARAGIPPEKATGDTAIYTPGSNGKNGQIILTGKTVSLNRGPSRLTGDRLVYNLQTQQATVTNSQGAVSATFIPQ